MGKLDIIAIFRIQGNILKYQSARYVYSRGCLEKKGNFFFVLFTYCPTREAQVWLKNRKSNKAAKAKQATLLPILMFK